jgi:hypothetical protein
MKSALIYRHYPVHAGASAENDGIPAPSPLLEGDFRHCKALHRH